MAEVEYYKAEEVAAIFRVSKMTVYRMVADGSIKAAKFGRSFRIPAAEVARLRGELS